MGVIIRSVDVADIIRMRKKDGDETVKPVIIEFKSEYDKWMVLRNKADLRETEEYERFFSERICRERKERRAEREYKRGKQNG